MASRRADKAKRPSTRASARVAESTPAYGIFVCYVESSALLAALLEGDGAARDSLRNAHTLVTSALTFAECRRAILRARTSGRVGANEARVLNRALTTFADRCAVVSVTSEILERAGASFPVEPLRTLDGIHLATIEALGEPRSSVTVLTRDIRVRENVKAMGFSAA